MSADDSSEKRGYCSNERMSKESAETDELLAILVLGIFTYTFNIQTLT